ncbi:MAG: chorismate mutase [Archangium sp.]|nr:chorismate mutase [Archangium sp.]
MRSPELEALRSKLDSIDDELLDLLSERAHVVAEIWAWKRKNGVERIDPERERALRERLLSRAESLGLSRAAIERVLAQIIGNSLK